MERKTPSKPPVMQHLAIVDLIWLFRALVLYHNWTIVGGGHWLLKKNDWFLARIGKIRQWNRPKVTLKLRGLCSFDNQWGLQWKMRSLSLLWSQQSMWWAKCWSLRISSKQDMIWISLGTFLLKTKKGIQHNLKSNVTWIDSIYAQQQRKGRNFHCAELCHCTALQQILHAEITFTIFLKHGALFSQWQAEGSKWHFYKNWKWCCLKCCSKLKPSQKSRLTSK